MAELVKLEVPEGTPVPVRSHNGDAHMPDGYGFIWADPGQVQSLKAQGCLETGQTISYARSGDEPDTLQPNTVEVQEDAKAATEVTLSAKVTRAQHKK